MAVAAPIIEPGLALPKPASVSSTDDVLFPEPASPSSPAAEPHHVVARRRTAPHSPIQPLTGKLTLPNHPANHPTTGPGSNPPTQKNHKSPINVFNWIKAGQSSGTYDSRPQSKQQSIYSTFPRKSKETPRNSSDIYQDPSLVRTHKHKQWLNEVEYSKIGYNINNGQEKNNNTVTLKDRQSRVLVNRGRQALPPSVLRAPPPVPYGTPPQKPPRLNHSENSRRLTWSPPIKARYTMGPVSTFQNMRSYKSNDALDMVADADEDENLYEELDHAVATAEWYSQYERSVTGENGRPPPRIAPIGGVPTGTQQSMIKPIAFKPVATSHPLPRQGLAARYTPHHSQQVLPRGQRFSPLPSPPPPQQVSPAIPKRPNDQRLTSHDEGYVSQEYGGHNGSLLSTSQHSAYLQSPTSPTLTDHSHQSAYERSPKQHNSSAYEQSPRFKHSSPGISRQHSYERSPQVYSDFHRPPPGQLMYATASITRGRSLGSNGDAGSYLQTPSPSDSGLGEFELMMRDKDAEIHRLRTTMEKNEAAIIHVYEEKQQNFQIELQEVQDMWERRLRQHQERAFKMEQALLLQIFKLQQERKTLRIDQEQLKTEHEQLKHKSSELEDKNQSLKTSFDKNVELSESLNTKIEDLQWQLCQKSGEMSLFKSQLKDSQEEAANRGSELIAFKNQVRELTQEKLSKEAEFKTLQAELRRVAPELESMRSEIEYLQKQLCKPTLDTSNHSESIITPTNNNNLLLSKSPKITASSSPNIVPRISNTQSHAQLQRDLDETRRHLEETRKKFDQEKSQWLEEKNKVVRYQKHLQLNYVQMYRKNKTLESEVEQLMMEIENRDLQLGLNEDEVGEESQC